MSTTVSEQTAFDLQARFARDVDRIRANPGLSQQGKKAHIAKLYLEIFGEITAAGQAATDDITAKVRGAERRLFGLDTITRGASAADRAAISVSHRDAQDRAAQVRNVADAASLLNRAETSGDEILARAVANAAWDRDWHEVVDTYAATRPDSIADFQLLADNKASTSSGDALTDRLHRALAYRLTAPTEIAGLMDYQLSALAQEA